MSELEPVQDKFLVPRLSPIYTNIVDGVESAIDSIIESGNLEEGFNLINDMLSYVKAADDSIGVVLNKMSEAWIPEKNSDERFEAAILRKTGLQPATVHRHLKIQRALPQIPEEYREGIQEKGFKEKIRIAELVVGGYEVTNKDWRDLAEAPDEKEVGRITRKVKKEEPRSNWLAISIDSNGVLREHTKNGVRECGRLHVHDDNPDVQKAIARLLGCAGVQPASEY